MTVRRLPVLVVIVLALVGAVVAERHTTTAAPVDVVANTGIMPVASPPASVSTAFFCAGGTATPNGDFDASIVVANPNASPATVIITTYPSALPGDQAGAAQIAALHPAAKTLAVGGRSRAELHLADLQASPFVSAVVETSDPDIAVERRVTGRFGTGSSACASAPSTSWYFPTGISTKDATLRYAVFNPFPQDAVVDITFQTSDGARVPPELQALPVPGGTTRIIDVSGIVPRLAQLAGAVVARQGQVVVDRLQSFNGTDPAHPAGGAVTVGAPAPSTAWAFADGLVTAGMTDTITVQNPTDRAAHAQLEVVLDDPARNGAVDPIPVTVDPHGYAQIALQDQTRIPKDVALAVTVRVLDGGSVVAERVVTGAAPAPRKGYGPTIGAPLRSTHWVFPDGAAVANTTAESIVLVNPSHQPARVDISALAQGQALAIDGLQGLQIPPGQRLAVDLGAHVNRPDLTVVVDADQPVVAERGLYSATGLGLSMAMGIPLSETAELLGG